MHGGIVFRGWQEHGAIAHQRNAEERRVVAEGPEQDGVVARSTLPQMLEQRWHLRAILTKPFFLPPGRCQSVEYLFAQRPELVQMPRPRDSKPNHTHRAIGRFTGRV